MERRLVVAEPFGVSSTRILILHGGLNDPEMSRNARD
jgi:hypothetical protein